MARVKLLAAPDRHWLRHIRQVPEGTPGAIQDATFGAWWLVSSHDDGLVFVQAQDTQTLGDESELDLTLPSTDRAGRSAGDRFYFLAGTPDVSPAAPAGSMAPYHPGDEFFELYRGRSELVMSGTPYDAQPTVGQVVTNCGDVFRLLRKARETTAGWWCHAPRDAFEHYTRLWQALISDDFQDAPVQFPASPGDGTTPDGLWDYVNTQTGGISYAALANNGQIHTTRTWLDAGIAEHSCWRAEVIIAVAGVVSGSVPVMALQAIIDDGTPVIQLQLTPAGGIGIETLDLATSTVLEWPVDTSSLFAAGTAAALTPPYSLAIEARDRWLFFYVDGQFVGNAPRPDLSTSPELAAQVQATSMGAGDLIYVDSVVVRKTTPPLNGGDPGDYFLPSPPAAGGLTGEYFDLASFQAQYGPGAGPGPGGSVPLFGSPLIAVTGSVFKLGERQDGTLAFGQTDTQPTWQLPCTYQFGVRWSGAVYLPLDTQDVHFAAPTTGAHGTLDQFRLWVGKTRSGEQILTNAPDDPAPVLASVGMRSVFGEIPGWYPIVYEWTFLGSGGGVDYTTNPEITWDVGGGGTTIPAGMLAPLGCFRQQVKNDSHYDTLQSTLAQAFAYQFTCEPRPFESEFFPGAIVPRARVGRDTDLIVDETIGIDPQPSFIGEDIADAVLADAQGLGGSSSGDLTLEAFNFGALLQHPFVSSELENIPSTTVAAQLLTTLLTLVGFREAQWEQLQSSVAPVRQKQDTWPLTGDLAEFDWKPGDGLRVRLPSVFIEDVIPRQIYTVQRTRTPDGISAAQATFQPRIRTPENTLRKFIRQVYGRSRTFQGQLVQSESAHVDAPAQVAVSLPLDVTRVRRAEVIVVASDGYGGTIEINGVDTGIPASAVGPYNITQLVAKNNGFEPRMLVDLTAPGAGQSVTYCVRLTVLLPSF